MRLDARMDYGPVAPDTETLTCPRRMRASDGFDYVVKVRDGGPKSLFNEYVAAKIAQWAGLSVAEPAIVHLGAKFIERTPALRSDRVRPGPYFATKFYDKAYDVYDMAGPRPKPAAITNLEEVPGFVAFDVFVNNTDRNDGNTILVPSNGGRAGYRYLLIDHGHCFGGPKWDSDTAADLPYEIADVPWQTGGTMGEVSFRDPVDKIARMNRDDMDRAKDGLPGEWDIPGGDYDALKNTMSSREPGKMLDAIRDAIKSGKFRPAVRPGALDRWAS